MAAFGIINRPVDEVPLAHLTGTRIVARRRGLLPKRRPTRAAIRPIDPKNLRRLADVLGPRPSERLDGSSRPSRDRLIIDLALSVGLRVHEVRALTRYQFLSLSPDPGAPGSNLGIFIKGKGGTIRQVAVPNWITEDVLTYIHGERAYAVKRRPGKFTDAPDLFLAGIDSRDVGKPISQRR